MRKRKILSVALFLVITIAFLNSSLGLMTVGMCCASGDESTKQQLCVRPCNFDGVIPNAADTRPQGASIKDYNLTDNWGGTWCDAEKTTDDKDDNLMCWAAAASNVLEWTGWGFVEHDIEGEMTNCDQMFEHFNDHWEDQGSLSNIGWMWWFNGEPGLPGDYPNDPPYNGGPAVWSEVDVPDGGDFWDPPHAFNNYFHEYGPGPNTLQYINTSLTSGWGVALGIYDGGHAITCWGFTYNDTVDPDTNPEDYYLGVWVTDSDDDKWPYNSWDPPPDSIRYYNVSYDSGISRWKFDTYGGGGWHIDLVYALEKNTFLEPDLAIHKSAYPDVVMAGEELFYTITVVNENEIVGGVTAYNVVVTDILPDGVTYIGDTGGCVLVSGSTYSCSLGDIAPGDSKSFTIKVRVDLDYVVNYGYTVTNTASVTSDTRTWESDLRDNEVTVTTFVQDEVADLELTKSGPSSVTTCILSEEPTFEYTLTVKNNGPSTAVNVLIEDWLPAGVGINSVTSSQGSCNAGVPGDASRPTTCAIDSLARDASATMTINVTVLKPSDLSMESWILHNDALVSSDTPDLNNSNNLASKNTTIINTCIQELTDLKVLKFCKPDTTVLAGQIINCTIIVENLGPNVAYNVSIRDEILSSGNFTIVGAFSDPNRDDSTTSNTSPLGVWTFEFNLMEPLEPKNMTNQGQWVVQVLLRANETQDINNIVNVFTRTSRTVDPDLSNNEAQCSIHVTSVADLELTKTDTPDPLFAIAGQGPFLLTYNLTVTNHGPSTAVNVLIEDWLPEGLTILSVDATGNGSCNAGVPGDPSSPTTCTFDSLAPGASETVTIRTILLSTGLVIIKPSNLLHNDALVSSDTLDIDNSNNLASEDTTVVENSYGLGTVLNALGNPNTVGSILVGLISMCIAIGMWKKRTLLHVWVQVGSIAKHFRLKRES